MTKIVEENGNMSEHPHGFGRSPSGILAAALVTFACVVFATHILTTLRARSLQKEHDGSLRPTLQPYWVPWLGHILGLSYNPEAALRSARDQTTEDIFALKLNGKIHNILASTEFLGAFTQTKVLNANKERATSNHAARERILQYVFRSPQHDTASIAALQSRLDAALAGELNSPEKLSSIYNQIASFLRAHLPDLLTFNPSPVDQEPWERASLPTLSENRESATVFLFKLTTTFLTHLTTDVLLSPSLLSQEPTISTDLLALRNHYKLLVSGLPRTVPHPSLPAAHITARTLQGKVATFSRALELATSDKDPGPEYRDLLEGSDSIKPILAARQAILYPPEGPLLSEEAASADFGHLLWGINATNTLAFWLLMHLIADPDVLARVTDESSRFVRLHRPDGILGFAASPDIKIDTLGLIEQCPLLHSCYVETVRLYARGMDSREVLETTIVDVPASNDTSTSTVQKWKVKQGEFITEPFWLVNLDRRRWRDPDRWKADRHIAEFEQDGSPSRTIVDDTHIIQKLGVFGLDEISSANRAICLSFVAAFLALWEISPVEGRDGVTIPRARFAPGVALPSPDVAVSITSRKTS